MNWDKPIAEGVYKGVYWKSMTTVGQMTTTVLMYELRYHNINRQLFGLPPLTAAEYCRQRYKKTVYQYMKSIKRLKFYTVMGRYNNNKPIMNK